MTKTGLNELAQQSTVKRRRRMRNIRNEWVDDQSPDPVRSYGERAVESKRKESGMTFNGEMGTNGSEFFYLSNTSYQNQLGNASQK